MSEAHDDHFGSAFEGDDLPPHHAVPEEPKSPLWLPFLGGAILAVTLTWWLSTPTAEEEARAAAAASASASASAAASAPPLASVEPAAQPEAKPAAPPPPAPPTPRPAPPKLPGGIKAPGAADIKQMKPPGH
ncbi:MAG: hypothetical protein JNL79_33965 [Myxococcales bacterium]|nr:hypothetical protein [Myxococcales bacterium]